MFSLITFVLTVVCIIHAATAGADCGRFCKFRFCVAEEMARVRKKCPVILLRDPAVTLTSYVCHPRIPNLGKIRRTGEALVAFPGEAPVPISSWNPATSPPLSNSFPDNYFNLKEIPFLKARFRGIRRKVAVGNQKDFLDNICVILPMNIWETLNSDGTVKKTFTSNKKKDCVAFTTNYAVVLVELSWSNSEDLDLSLTEPNGAAVIDRNTPSSAAGYLDRDDNVADCGGFAWGREAIIYNYQNRTLIPNGMYNWRVTRKSSCGSPKVKWRVRVLVDEVVVQVKKGTFKFGDSNNIATGSFQVSLPTV